MRLTYNHTCSAGGGRDIGASYSHELIPDIVVERSGALLILDAKNKGTGQGYGDSEDGYVKKVKSEDIDKMHCYRDAIVGAVGAFALFPGTDGSSMYAAMDDGQRWNGVGALPLRPMADATVEPLHLSTLKSFILAFLDAHPQPTGPTE